MFNRIFRMPPFKRGDVQQQTDDIRDYLTQFIRQLNEEEPEQAQQTEQETESEVGKGNEVHTESGSVSVDSGAGTKLGSITLKKGTYILEASVLWSANSAGYRILNCSETEGSVARQLHNSAVQTVNFATTLPMSVVQCIKLTREKTFYCNGFHNSGATLQASWSMKATRID